MKIIAIAVLAAAAVTFASCTSYAAPGEPGEPGEPAVDDNGRDRPAKSEDTDQDDEFFRGGFIGGVGFPRPLAIEGLLKFDRIVSVGLEYSALPKTSFGSVSTSFWGIAGDVRLFPFRGAFFLGFRLGRQSMSGSATVSADTTGTTNQGVSADTWFVNPRMGVLYTWRSGFTLGIDAGIQLPIHTSRTSTLPDGTASGVTSTIASVEDTLGAGVTPTIDLLRIGFMF